MSEEAILQRNRMTYEVSQPTSLKTRPHDIIQQPFTEQQYSPRETAICHFPTGKYFVDPTKSYVVLRVKLFNEQVPQQNCSASFSKGSAQNLIKDIRLFHRSGTTISSQQDRDIYVKARDYIQHDDFWFSSIGYTMGYRPNNSDYTMSSFDPAGKVFKIPLDELHGFFRGHSSRLLPPEIIDGLRMELVLNSKEQALYRNISEGEISRVVIEPELQICLVACMDNALISIQNKANKQGLSWTYDDTFVSEKIQNSDDELFNTTIEKSVSVAKNAITLVRDTANLNNIDNDGYSFNDYDSPLNYWHYQLGNDLYPYKKKINNYQDTYTIVLDAFKTEYGLNLDSNDFLHNYVLVTSLLTDDYLQMSGDFINSNKRLFFEKITGDTQTTNKWSLCLTHVKVLRVNDSSSRVDE